MKKCLLLVAIVAMAFCGKTFAGDAGDNLMRAAGAIRSVTQPGGSRVSGGRIKMKCIHCNGTGLQGSFECGFCKGAGMK